MTGLAAGLGAVFAVTGLSLSALGVRQTLRRRAFLRRSLTAPGTVVGVAESPQGEDILYHPRIRYRAADGSERVFESQTGSTRPGLAVGAPVTVRYDPERPEGAEVESFMALWGLALVFDLLGSVFLLVGLGVLLGGIPA